MKTIRVMPLVTVQNSQLGHTIHSTNHFFNIHDDTVFKKHECSYLDSITKDNNFLTYLRHIISACCKSSVLDG